MKKTKLSLLIGLTVAPIFAYGAYGFAVSTTASVAAERAAATSSQNIQRIGKSQMALATAIQDNTSLIVEAIRTNISQEALSATLIAKGDADTRQMRIAAEESAKSTAKSLEIMLDYGAQTGQGHQTCVAYTKANQLNSATGEAMLKTTKTVQASDNAPGKLAESAETAKAKREEIHKKNFCTEDEAARGLCELSEDLPGGDSNAALLYESAKPGTKVALAKEQVRQNILGSPDVAIPKSSGRTVTGQSYLYNTNRKTAIAAFPAYSLAYLQNMTEVREDLKDAKGKNVSPKELLLNTVAGYYGTDEAVEWQKSMAQQRPRGLLVELAKMEGLGAWMDYQRHLTNQRMGGNMASLVIAASLPMEERQVEQQRRLARSSTSAMVTQ